MPPSADLDHIDWDRLFTTEAWAELLKQISVAALHAVEAADLDRMGRLQEILRSYTRKSPPKVQSLDLIANDLAADLMAADFVHTAEAIRSRNAELQRQMDVIKGTAEQAKSAAAALRLQPVIDQLNDARQALVQLREELEARKDTGNAWYQKAKDAISSLDAFLKSP